jgi:glyoxylase-like metal-dependent hydrolase (beta-lactamase superfamily II)/rhodanese-related sulfurtransferase
MIFRQVIHDDLGCASYLIGDEGAGVAAVVDPRLDVDVYLDLATLLGVEITDVIETHTHADHVSGHGRLAERTGATIHINPEADAEYAHEAMPDGAEVVLGDAVLRAVHLPGHRPEHTVIEVIDRGRAPEPWSLLSGDSLLVGDIARPDLAVEKEEGAALLYDGLTAVLDRLAPETELWPGHIGGSSCGSEGIDMKTSSTLGYERAHNELLALPKKEFVLRMTGNLGEQPANFEAIVGINEGPLTAASAPPREVNAAGLAALLADGVVPVDTRETAAFDEGHIPGAISVPAGKPGFASSLARIRGASDRIALIGDDTESAHDAVRLAEAVGIADVEAVLVGGLAAWDAAGKELEAIQTMSPEELAGHLTEPEMQVVDVRSTKAFGKRSISGSVNASYDELDAIPQGVDPARPVAVACTLGHRSGIGASLLRRAGVMQVIHVTGGGVNEVIDALER